MGMIADALAWGIALAIQVAALSIYSGPLAPLCSCSVLIAVCSAGFVLNFFSKTLSKSLITTSHMVGYACSAASVIVCLQWQRELHAHTYAIALSASAAPFVLLTLAQAVAMKLVESDHISDNPVFVEYAQIIEVSTMFKGLLVLFQTASLGVYLLGEDASSLFGLVITIWLGISAANVLTATIFRLYLSVAQESSGRTIRRFVATYLALDSFDVLCSCAVLCVILVVSPENSDSQSLVAKQLAYCAAILFLFFTCVRLCAVLTSSNVSAKYVHMIQLISPAFSAHEYPSDIPSSPCMLTLGLIAWYFLFFSVPTVAVLGESIADPMSCALGRQFLSVDLVAGVASVLLLALCVFFEMTKSPHALSCALFVCACLSCGYLAFKCLLLWAFGYMTCDGHFESDIRHTIIANLFFYFMALFIYCSFVAFTVSENGDPVVWRTLGASDGYFSNLSVKAATKQMAEHAIPWGIFYCVVVPWEAIATAYCGASEKAGTWPYPPTSDSGDSHCVDTSWYPGTVLFSSLTMVVITICTIITRLHRPLVLVNTRTSFGYYFWSDIIVHVTLLGNLVISIGTLATIPRNHGWGVTFTITHTFRLLAFIFFSIHEIATVQDRHNALSEAVVAYLQSETDMHASAVGDNHVLNIDDLAIIDSDTIFSTGVSVRRRPSEELRLVAVRARILSQAKRGGNWVRKLGLEGTVVWVNKAEQGGDGMLDDIGENENVEGCADEDGRSMSVTDDSKQDNPIVKQRKSQEFRASVGWYMQSFDSTGCLVWKPGEELETISSIPAGVFRDLNTSVLAAVSMLSFQEKCLWVRGKLDQMRVPWESGHLELRIRRNSLLEDSIRELNGVAADRLRQTFRFQFEGEQGLDAGGVAREWFMCLSRDVFSPTLGLFKFASTDNITYQLNPTAEETLGTDRHQELCTFVGRYLAKALFDQHIISAHLVRPLYKHLLGVPVGFGDLQFVDSQLYDNMCWLMKTEQVDQLSLTFTITTEARSVDGGTCMREEELVPGGMSMLVTDENKQQYLREAFRRRMLDQQRTALEHLLKGFYDLIPPALLCVFDSQELELLMCGLDDVDIKDWEANTDYEGVYNANHKLVQWFWSIMQGLTTEQKARLLQYVTGTSRVPVGGFGNLQGVDGQVKKFTLRSIALTEGEYPRSHTCFNRLDMPVYTSKEHLQNVLTHLTTMEIEGFSMD